MECRGTHSLGLKKSVNHDCEGWTASSVVIHWSISIPISDPLFTENNIRGRDLCTVWPWYVFFKKLFRRWKLEPQFWHLLLLFECWFGYFHFKTTKKCFALPVARRSFTIMEFFVGLAQSQGYKPDAGQFCKSSSPSWSTCWSTCKGCKYGRTLWIWNFILWSWSILP